MKEKQKIRALMMMADKSSAIAAGYSLSEARAAGYSLSEARAAGYSLSEARAAGYSEEDLKEWDSIPILENPYYTLQKEIEEKKRVYQQSTWGKCEDFDPKLNLCKSAGCMAFHLVQMAGVIGWGLKKKYGFPLAASLIHYKTHPEISAPNFNSTNQSDGMAYIEYMAEYEETGVKP